MRKIILFASLLAIASCTKKHDCYTVTPGGPKRPGGTGPGTTLVAKIDSGFFVSKYSAVANPTIAIGDSDAIAAGFELQNQNAFPDTVRYVHVYYNGDPALLKSFKKISIGFPGVGTYGFVPDSALQLGVTIPFPSGNALSMYVDLTPGTKTGTCSFTTVIENSKGELLMPGTPVQGQTVTIVAPGPTDLIASINTGASTGTQYVAVGTTTGSVDATTATFNFTTVNTPKDINELTFREEITPSASTMIRIGTVSAPFISGSGALVTGINVHVPSGPGGTNVNVLSSYVPVGPSGIPSGSICYVTLTGAHYASGSTIGMQTFTVSAPPVCLVASKPTVSSGYGSTLSMGSDTKIAELTVSADPKGDISIGGLTFSVITTDISSFFLSAIHVTDGSSATIPGTSGSFSGSFATIVFASDYVISAGTSATFSVYGTPSGSAGTSAAISTTAAPDQFLWTDVAGGGTSRAENGVKIWNFPTSAFIAH